MSLRRRLSLVLCVVLILPLVVVALLVGIAVPRVATDAADGRLVTSARAAAATLAAQCESMGETARALALEATPSLGSGVDPGVARTAVTAVVRARPGASAAVVGPAGVVAQAGPASDLEASSGRSCAGGDVVLAAGAPALVQSVPVAGGVEPAVAVIAVPLDVDLLERLIADLGLFGDLVVVADGEALAATVDTELAAQIAVGSGAAGPQAPVDLAGQRVVADTGGRGLGVRVLAVGTEEKKSAATAVARSERPCAAM